MTEGRELEQARRDDAPRSSPAPAVRAKGRIAVAAPLTFGRWTGALVVLLALAGAAAAASALFGLPRIDVLGALADPALAPRDADILFKLRLPRILAAGLVGACLALCGAVLQALLRNPLAYPHILGISAGAAVGGIAARLFGFSVVTIAALELPGAAAAAFVTALGATLLVYRSACVRGRLEPVTLILVGVVFNSFAGALIMFLFAAADMRQAHGILFWMVGSLDLVDRGLLGWAAAVALAGSAVLLTLARPLNLMTLGDEVAAGLGVDVEKVRLAAFLATSVVVGAVVSLCGMIGFVGLIVPHVFRLMLGSDHRLLLPASFLGGAAFLIAADLAARSVFYPVELPVGVVTAFCGGPFFLFLLRRHRQRSLYNG